MGLLLITQAGAGARHRIYSSGSSSRSGRAGSGRSGLIDTVQRLGAGWGGTAHTLTLKVFYRNAGGVTLDRQRGEISSFSSSHIMLNVYEREQQRECFRIL